MTIHHDKLAYGKLAPNMEEIDEEQLLKMLEELNEEEQEEGESSEKGKQPTKNKLKKL